jgi:hypothetical protein
MLRASSGDNGDVSEEYARLLLCVVLGIACAIVWTIADRRRPRGEWTESTLRVLLRFSVALGLTSYAIAKILPQQFPPIADAILELRVGDLTPMSLLWTFMQYSRPYAFLAGALEMLVVILLCFRRTATLGALITVIVIGNVAVLNLAYGVPVKLYAMMITLSAAVLLLYDARRLRAMFVTNEAVGPARLTSILHERIPDAVRWGIKIALVGSVTLSSYVAMRSAIASRPQTALEATEYRLLQSRFRWISDR